ncbi:MAG TPA: Sir2 family NAD-dependent protein deacetylase [Nitrososphaerales archaeon]|nr:Sir2 family NAD-dependent protein deacetylase [Nitrososphaerales archaeon]
MENLIERAARDLLKSEYAIALTGAGVSTESGIPDFRGPSGIWTRDPDAERRAYQSYERFLEDPREWWKERLTSSSPFGDIERLRPNPGHLALAELERLGILKCVITQNIDGLHEKAGTKNLVEYHGSALKLRCSLCSSRFARDQFDLRRLMFDDKLPPLCPLCGGVLKTDSVAFGEPIPHNVSRLSLEETRRCDLMLICGTSAVVYPFAQLPRIARERRFARKEEMTRTGSGLPIDEDLQAVTIIEVNAEPTLLTQEGVSDYLIRGKTGEILPRIVERVLKTKPLSGRGGSSGRPGA